MFEYETDWRIRANAFEALGFDWHVAETFAYGDYGTAIRYLINTRKLKL